jgi:CheY-like chemotaxis protein
MNERPPILVVEDDDDCRSVLVDLLEMSGYSVLSCGEAHRAVEMAREHQPALVLVDFMMPDADGGWLVRSLRAEGGDLADVPVVLTTGSSAGREIADSLGVRSLEKPFDVNRLLELVQTLARMS